MRQLLPARNRRSGVAAAVSGLLVLALSTAVAQAASSAPTPVTPKFGKAIEAPANYQPATICDPVDRPGATALKGLIQDTYGADQVIGISRFSSCGTVSEHNEGRALDWMLDASNTADMAKAKAFLGWLLAKDSHGHDFAMARRLGVMYVIWDRRIWASYNPIWRDYTGSVPHTDHIHISLSRDGATGRTSFWTGHPMPGPCHLAQLSSSAPAAASTLTYVPVTPTRVLSTSTGLGTSTSRPCRATDSERVDAIVTGVGSVPTDAVSVALAVTANGSNARSFISVVPAGSAASPARGLSYDFGEKRTSTLVTGVGADGKVSFFTSLGATDLAVSVVGYYVDPTASLGLGDPPGDLYHPMWARRLASANDTVIPAGESTTVAVAGRDGVPTDATAAVVSVTSRAADTAGALFVYPSGGTAPSDPAVYARAGERVTGTAIVPLGSNGNVDVSNVGGSDRAVDVDIVGWYAAPSASGPGANGIGYVAKRHPKPVLDTATDRGLGSLGPDATGTFGVGAAVPDGARAVVMQVTVKQANPATRLTLWRADKARPGTVNLSVPGGRTVTTMVIVPVRATQPRVSIHNHAGSVSIRATVVGYYLDPSLG